MAKTIYKFQLEITDEQFLSLHKGYEILSVQVQRGTPYLWALIDPTEPLRATVCIETFGTGNPIPEGNRTFIDTYQVHGGNLVFHVFHRNPVNS